MIQARRGQRTAALAAAEEATRLPKHRYDADPFGVVWLAQAEVLAALFQADDAIAELRARHEVGWALGHTLRLDPGGSRCAATRNFSN